MTFTRCTQGHTHWGQHGAAGLLLIDNGKALLQLRSTTVHQGSCWSIPGGALLDGESPTDGALREAAEETGLDPTMVRITSTHTQDCGGWKYTTCIALVPMGTKLAGNWESEQLRWVPLADVGKNPHLHPGFKTAWARLSTIVDTTKLNISRVTNQLWTGGNNGHTPLTTWQGQLQTAGITHIIDCTDQPDAGQVMPDDWFADGVDFALHAMRNPDAQVLAHCQLGINRGPSMAYAILLATGMKPDQALATIKAARPIAHVAYADQATTWWAKLTAPPPTVFYHGGRPGLHVGDFLQPPTQSGVHAAIDYLNLDDLAPNQLHAVNLARRDRVYLTTNKNDATLWASLHRLGTPTRGGDVYRAEPEGDTEPDPDYIGPATVVHCARARIVEVVDTHVRRGPVTTPSSNQRKA
jgi:8-oxo-dGTP diphosphatase